MGIQTTERLKGEDGLVTVESIADHIRNGMQNWQRPLNWWAGYLQRIANAGYEVNLLAMDIEAGLGTRDMTYNPPGGPEIEILQVINYLYANEQWAAANKIARHGRNPARPAPQTGKRNGSILPRPSTAAKP